MKTLFDAFGPKRMFWGTDLTRMPCTYYECIHLFTDHLPWLGGEDLEWVMGRGVCEWLGRPLPKSRRARSRGHLNADGPRRWQRALTAGGAAPTNCTFLQ